MEDGQIINKRGLLKEDFRIFYLKDKVSNTVEYHYHDFDKIVLCLNGKVSYVIEGKRYFLNQNDVLFVRHDDIHKPIIDENVEYERIVIWINPSFLKYVDNVALDNCFNFVKENSVCLYRANGENYLYLKNIILNLKRECLNANFAKEVLLKAYFLELMVFLNRFIKEYDSNSILNSYEYDEGIEKILKYINANLKEDLSVDMLAQKLFLSRYHFMRRFKEVSGYTVHNYILNKRIFLAISLLNDDRNITDIALECGFKEYSSFLRAFKKVIGKTPKEFKEI